MPRIGNVREVIKENHKVQVGVHSIFADFVEGGFVDAGFPRIYEEEVGVSLHFVDKPLRLASCVSAKGNPEKDVLLVNFAFGAVVNIDYDGAEEGGQQNDG